MVTASQGIQVTITNGGTDRSMDPGREGLTHPISFVGLLLELPTSNPIREAPGKLQTEGHTNRQLTPKANVMKD
jgi:hypothetical protein